MREIFFIVNEENEEFNANGFTVSLIFSNYIYMGCFDRHFIWRN